MLSLEGNGCICSQGVNSWFLNYVKLFTYSSVPGSMWSDVSNQAEKFLSHMPKRLHSFLGVRSGSLALLVLWPTLPRGAEHRVWHEELRLPQELFAVGAPIIAVFQTGIKHSWAAHGAGTCVVFSLHVLSHSWGLAVPRSTGGEDGMAGCAGPQPSWVWGFEWQR